jgi:hypothetical protein
LSLEVLYSGEWKNVFFFHHIFQKPIKTFGPCFRLFILELKAVVRINFSFSIFFFYTKAEFAGAS